MSLARLRLISEGQKNIYAPKINSITIIIISGGTLKEIKASHRNFEPCSIHGNSQREQQETTETSKEQKFQANKCISLSIVAKKICHRKFLIPTE